MWNRAVVVLAVLSFTGLGGSAAQADPQPAGNPFPLSGCQTCRQEGAFVAGSPNGSFFTAWEGSSPTDARGALGRFFNAAGSAPARELLINLESAPVQRDVTVVPVRSRGEFIVAWSAEAAGNNDILAQRFSNRGRALGSAFRVNTDDLTAPSIPQDLAPAVAVAADGSFAVAWISFLPPRNPFVGTPPTVWARRFDATGRPLGPQVKLSTGLVDTARPDACFDTSGKLVTVWTSLDQVRPFEPSRKGVALRRLTTAGSPEGTAEQAVAAPLAEDVSTSVSCGQGSTFVVVWHSDQPPAGVESDILGLRFSRLGRPVGAPFVVNANRVGVQRTPVVSHDPTGHFVVAWESLGGADKTLRGRRFLAGGGAASAEFEVARLSNNDLRLSAPEMAHTGSGNNFVVVWQDGTRGLFGRRFTVPSSDH